MTEARRRLGETLVEAGVLTQEALDRALAIQQKQQLRLGTILLQEGFVTESQLVQALSLKLSIPWVSLWRIDIPDEVLQLVPSNIAEEFFLMPIYIRVSKTGERILYVAMNDPGDEDALRFVTANAGMPVKAMIAGPSDIAAAIRAYYYGEDEALDEEDESGHPVVPAASHAEHAEPSSPPPPHASGTGAAPPPPPTPHRASQPEKPPAPPSEAEAAVADVVAASAPETVTPEAPPAPAEAASPQPEAAAPSEPAAEDADKPAEPAPEAPDAATETPATALVADSAGGEDKVFADKTQAQREAEKLLYGVGGSKPTRGFSLTLLDGTTISFGPKKKKGKAGAASLTQDDLLAGLKAAAMGTPMDDFLPATHWESYMAALLQVLLNKHLVFFPELMKELESIEKKK